MSDMIGPPPEPGQFQRPYIRFGHASPAGEPGQTPTIPNNTPSHHETVPAGVGDPGGSPIDAIRIDGQPRQPLPVDRVTLPGSPVNVFEAAGPAPDVTVQVANLRNAAGSQTSAMTAPPSGVPRSGRAPEFIAPSGVDSERRAS